MSLPRIREFRVVFVREVDMTAADWIALAALGVNTFVLGAAVWAVNMQREELGLQRKELELTRDELKAQRLAQEDQARSQSSSARVATLQLVADALNVLYQRRIAEQTKDPAVHAFERASGHYDEAPEVRFGAIIDRLAEESIILAGLERS